MGGACDMKGDKHRKPKKEVLRLSRSSKFITVFTTALPRAKIYIPQPPSLRNILILSSHL
jgi:hypothetical protein